MFCLVFNFCCREKKEYKIVKLKFAANSQNRKVLWKVFVMWDGYICKSPICQAHNANSRFWHKKEDFVYFSSIISKIMEMKTSQLNLRPSCRRHEKKTGGNH